MPVRTIVLDANIPIRFVLGEKVPALLSAHAAAIDFLAPDTAYEEARKHVPLILRVRGEGSTGEAEALDELDAVTSIVRPVPASSYAPMRAPAMARIVGRVDPCARIGLEIAFAHDDLSFRLLVLSGEKFAPVDSDILAGHLVDRQTDPANRRIRAAYDAQPFKQDLRLRMDVADGPGDACVGEASDPRGSQRHVGAARSKASG